MSSADVTDAPCAAGSSDEVKNARRKRGRKGKGKRKSDEHLTENDPTEEGQSSQKTPGTEQREGSGRGRNRGRNHSHQQGHRQDQGHSQGQRQDQGQAPSHRGNRSNRGQRGDRHGGERGGRGMRYSQLRGSPRGSPTRADNNWGQGGHPGRSSPLNVPGYSNNHQRGQPPGSPHSPGPYPHSLGPYPQSPGPYPQSPGGYPQSPGPYNNSPGMYAPYPYNPASPHSPYGQGIPNPFFQGQSPQQGHNQRGHQRGNPNAQSNRQRPQKNNQNQKRKLFEPHWTMEEVSHGLKRGELIQGPLRINPRNYEDCYVPHPDGMSDIYICGTKDRNRALNSDIVIVQLYPREEWKVLLDDLETHDTRPSTTKGQSAGSDTTPSTSDFAALTLSDTAATNQATPASTSDTNTPQPTSTTTDNTDNKDNTTTTSIVDPALATTSIESKTVPPAKTCATELSVESGPTPSPDTAPAATPTTSTETTLASNPESAVSKTDQSEAQKKTGEPDETLGKTDKPAEVVEQTEPADPVGDSTKPKNVRTNTPHSERLLNKKQGKQNMRSNTPRNETPRNETPVGQNGSSVKKQGQRAGQATPRKRYTTLRDYASTPDINRVTKKLFSNDKGVKEEKEGKEKEAREEMNPQQVKDRMDAVPNKALLRTGKIVAILEKKNSHAATGHLRLMADKNNHTALFAPIDHRFPRIMVPMEDCPKDFHERPEDHSQVLFVVQLTEWEEHSQYARGRLKRSLGEAGEIEPETEGILISYDVDYSEFSDETIACLPQNLPWTIPPAEFEYRKDLRKECVFTIDPATARDLDDALHVKDLGDGIFEVGVHIADVSFFLEDDTALDEVASQRSTSVYLVQKVIPMLPRLLCEQLCSLNPDEDRLTFSVIWKMTEEGEILDEWFGRSVIRSCVKMAYDHAQGFIEEPDREWTETKLPPISGGFSVDTIKEKVLYLQQIARNLRKKRFDGGALRLDQVKLSFALDKDTGMPNGYYVYKQRDSNKLIEEFMLLANMAVSHKIYKAFPKQAVLRRHPPPQTKMMDDLVKTCRGLGVPIDVSSSKSIHESIIAMAGETLEDLARVQILTVLCSKPMQNAKYFCTGTLEDEYEYRHYALNVPLYTHFTSPIRRYPDVMVHRLLAAALGYRPVPALDKATVQQRADHSNDKKTNSKRVQELSSEIFFAVFIKECGPIEERAMVMGVLDKSFDVLVLKLGVVKRVYCEKLPLRDFGATRKHGRPELRLIWNPTDDHPQPVTQDITVFSLVDCVLSADPEPLKWTAIIKHPNHAAVE